MPFSQWLNKVMYISLPSQFVKDNRCKDKIKLSHHPLKEYHQYHNKLWHKLKHR